MLEIIDSIFDYMRTTFITIPIGSEVFNFSLFNLMISVLFLEVVALPFLLKLIYGD